MNPVNDFEGIFFDYEQGFYTDVELVAKCFDLLGSGDGGVWRALPDWIKKEIKDKAMSAKEEDEFISFSEKSSDDIKKRMLDLKRWLESNH